MKERGKQVLVLAGILGVMAVIGGCAGQTQKTAGEASKTETTTAAATEAKTEAKTDTTTAETTEAQTSEKAEESDWKLPQKVMLGALGTHPPYNFMEDGKLVGYEVDIWNEIGKRNGFEIDYTTAQLSGLFGMLDTGKIDTILSQITITDERKEKYDFTTPYMYNPGGWLINKETDEIKEIQDLYGKSAAVVTGSVDIQMYENAAPNGEIEIVVFQEYSAAIKAVESGRVYAVGTAIPQGKYMLKSNPDLNLKLSGYNGITQVNGFPMNMEREDDLLEAASKTIEDMREEGLLKELSIKWFGMDTTVEQQDY